MGACSSPGQRGGLPSQTETRCVCKRCNKCCLPASHKALPLWVPLCEWPECLSCWILGLEACIPFGPSRPPASPATLVGRVPAGLPQSQAPLALLIMTRKTSTFYSHHVVRVWRCSMAWLAPTPPACVPVSQPPTPVVLQSVASLYRVRSCIPICRHHVACWNVCK
jgi:hypothetical protein